MQAARMAAREYLRAELDRKGVSLAETSRALGHADSYLSQYIKDGTPAWLKEADRGALLGLYPFLDETKLRPPPTPLSIAATRKRASRKGENQAQVHPPGYGKFVDDPRKLDLLDAWDAIASEDDRELAMTVVRQIAARARRAAVA